MVCDNSTSQGDEKEEENGDFMERHFVITAVKTQQAANPYSIHNQQTSFPYKSPPHNFGFHLNVAQVLSKQKEM